MTKMCDQKSVRETLRGAGPCEIGYEVLQRNGKPNWWCRTHGMPASAPDGAALDSCPGAWFDPVEAEQQLHLDLGVGESSVWGVVPAALQIGELPQQPGKIHVHHRKSATASKDIDRSFDIVRLRNGSRELVVEGVAAVAFSISELAGRDVTALKCPRCGGLHIDELKFATFPHSKHLCNSCGRNFRDRTGPSISNPLASAYELLDLAPAPKPKRVNRPLVLESSKYAAITIWPSNTAIVSTMTRPEEVGVHVHAWVVSGELVVDETHWPVTLDGLSIDDGALRHLAVQRALADSAPIFTSACTGCGSSLISPTTGWIEPVTHHICRGCGTVNVTRRRAFLNPLAEKLA